MSQWHPGKLERRRTATSAVQEGPAGQVCSDVVLVFEVAILLLRIALAVMSRPEALAAYAERRPLSEAEASTVAVGHRGLVKLAKSGA